MDSNELDRERAVILQEIHQSHDTPDDIVFDLFQETAFPDQDVGRPVLGTVDLVSGFNRDTLIDYMEAHYSPASIVVSAAGNIEHDQFVDMTSKAFDGLADPTPRTIEPSTYEGGDLRQSRDLEQVHYLMGFDGLSYSDPDYYAGSIYATLLGGGMSSRLFQEIREAKGLVYSIYSFMSSFQDGGIFGVYAGTGEQEVTEVVPIICHELTRSTKDISDIEVIRARAQIKASILMSLESTSSRCEQVARQLLIYGRVIPLDEVIAKIEAVDTQSVMRAASRIIDSTLTVTALGPINALESYDATVSRF
jgi:predicted Zn-dependent peptidase